VHRAGEPKKLPQPHPSAWLLLHTRVRQRSGMVL